MILAYPLQSILPAYSWRNTSLKEDPEDKIYISRDSLVAFFLLDFEVFFILCMGFQVYEISYVYK